MTHAAEAMAAHLCGYHKKYDPECGYCGEARDTLIAFAAQETAALRKELHQLKEERQAARALAKPYREPEL